MTWLLAFITIVACAALNRLRGDKSWMPSWLPGRALFYAAPAVGAVALLTNGWLVAGAFAAAYFFWAVFPWGFTLASLGGFTPPRDPDPLDAFLMRLGKPWGALARMGFVLPGAGLITYLTGAWIVMGLAAGFAVLATAAYWALFSPMGTYDWLRAEVATGGLWGVLIVLVGLLV